jgi:hypothetical protein
MGSAVKGVMMARRPPVATAVVTAVALSAGYALWTPGVPDLAAQFARAGIARSVGAVSWWTGWFGGLSLPTYSLTAPTVMAVAGVRGAGLLAVLAGSAAAAAMLRGSLRPRAGAVAFTVAQLANLFDGRVTFALGLAVGLWAAAAIQRRRSVFAVLLTVLCYAASPLAALFLGIACVGAAVADHSRRRLAAGCALVLLALSAAMQLLFPGTGRMPVTGMDVVPAAVSGIAVLLCCRSAAVRAGAATYLLALVLVLIWPGAVGTNVTRLAWVITAPLLVAYCALPRLGAFAAVALCAAWPASDLFGQVRDAQQPSSAAAFYRPLVSALDQQQAIAGPTAIGARVEMIDTANHWASAYVAPTVALARGWDRQTDRAEDPLFYQRAPLTSEEYHAWLHHVAARWVALPRRSPLDYASVAEANLVRTTPAYLTPVWTSPAWILYEVTDPTPLASTGRILAVTPTQIVLSLDGPRSLRIRLQWNPYLTLTSIDSRPYATGCLSDDAGQISAIAPRAGIYRVTYDFDGPTRKHLRQTCRA